MNKFMKQIQLFDSEAKSGDAPISVPSNFTLK